MLKVFGSKRAVKERVKYSNTVLASDKHITEKLLKKLQVLKELYELPIASRNFVMREF